MNKIQKAAIRTACLFIPVKKWRKQVRANIFSKDPTIETYKIFNYQGKELKLFQDSYNCGFYGKRMTERAIEMAVVKEWLKKIKENVTEVGAVTPYYFSSKKINDICDPYDPHKKVNNKCSMFDLDLTNKNVLSISTVEHIASGDYGVKINKNEDAVKGLEKIINESKNCLISVPTGINKLLDDYFAKEKFKNIKLNDNSILSVTLYERNAKDNNFKIQKDFKRANMLEYGPIAANGVLFIEKERKQ